jgi:hypothetical protein
MRGDRVEGHGAIENDVFIWRQGQAEVTLLREGDSWRIVCISTGRLLGPRQVMYEQRHKHAKQAAWDFMARVIRISSDEDQGLNAARAAAKWMHSIGAGNDTDD